MPQSKEYSERERMIDKCLSTGREYTSDQLMSKVNALLRSRGMMEISSRSTFAADINEINNKFFNTYHQDVIKRERRGRHFWYYYTIPDFSIYNRELTDEDIADISKMITTIRRFKGMPQFSWLETLEERFDQVVQKNQKSVVAFDDSYNEEAMKPFEALLNAIDNKAVIDIEYLGFYDDKTSHKTVNPYYLKQYGLRWYLLASFKGKDRIYTFALDRIKDVSQLPDEEYEPSDVDFEHYFDDIIGVAHFDNEIEHIEIWVAAEELPYIISKPFHKSQKIVSQDEYGAIISIDVRWNFELEQAILGYGDWVEVMEPVWLRLKLKERVQMLLDMYNTPEPGL